MMNRMNRKDIESISRLLREEVFDKQEGSPKQEKDKSPNEPRYHKSMKLNSMNEQQLEEKVRNAVAVVFGSSIESGLCDEIIGHVLNDYESADIEEDDMDSDGFYETQERARHLLKKCLIEYIEKNFAG